MLRYTILALLFAISTAACGDESEPTDGDDASANNNSMNSGNNGGNVGTNVNAGPQWEPLFDENTELDPAISFDNGDALITRFADRGRDRHAREAGFQAYEHYLDWYWEDRTIGVTVTDTIGHGGDTIRFDIVSPHKFDAREFRSFFYGRNTVAEYCNNGGMEPAYPDGSPMPMEIYEDSDPDQTHHYFTVLDTFQAPVSCDRSPLEIGQGIEIEISQFLDSPNNGRENYYGTTFLYVVGEGLRAWASTGEATGCCDENYGAASEPIPYDRLLGGGTTTHRNESDEPDNLFMQMATNTAPENAQPFMQGRRLIHTSFVDGLHDESPVDNPPQTQYAGMAGPAFLNASCNACHVRNGRAPTAQVGEELPKWIFKVGDGKGGPHPELGQMLQPAGEAGEGRVTLGEWVEEDGLRRPTFDYEGVEPEFVSPRISPQLVGMGLLEAIPESSIAALADPNDADGDGISGRMHIVQEVGGPWRVGRFGYKASQPTVRQQTAAALQTDMGVTTSLFPVHDCGPDKDGCDTPSEELGDAQLDELTLYISLLGVQPQAEHDGTGERVFDEIGCADCHAPSFVTSEYAPLAELRSQTIYPYTDLLLHDMGPGLADTYTDGDALTTEWRTAPLWGLGKSDGVTGQGNYLHDGRARTIDEAIRWHGGEGDASRTRYEALSEDDRNALLEFIETL